MAAALILAWLIVAPRSPDLAAQVYRANVFSHFGMLIWDDNWYGGHHMPGYSLTYPPLAAWIGVRALGALAALASTALFARIAAVVYGPRTTSATVWFAVAAVGDLWIGRVTFALGVSFALACALALILATRAPARSRRLQWLTLACLCGALSTVTSPVAGVLLGLALVTEMLVNRRLRPGLYVCIAIVVVLLPLELFFPEGGFEPYSLKSFLAASAVALGFVWALPKEERLLKTGGWLFLLVNALSLAPTPMGSNVVRYAVLLSGPLLLCALSRSERSARESGSLLGGRWGERQGWAVAVVLAGLGLWVVWGPFLQSREVLKEPSTKAAYYLPVKRFLAQHAQRPLRIEVPFTKAHWESALLAPYVPLARGWERQLDKRYDLGIEADPLSPSVYHRWLRDNAVSYVALADVPLDGSSKGEAALIRHGAPFLQEVLKTANWSIYKVLHTDPLASGPGTLSFLGHEGFGLAVRAPGRFLVRVHYTPYWTVIEGAGSVSEAPNGWTYVHARRPGSLLVQARFSLGAALKLL
jgi:hypothetical protein